MYVSQGRISVFKLFYSWFSKQHLGFVFVWNKVEQMISVKEKFVGCLVLLFSYSMSLPERDMWSLPLALLAIQR